MEVSLDTRRGAGWTCEILIVWFDLWPPGWGDPTPQHVWYYNSAKHPSSLCQVGDPRPHENYHWKVLTAIVTTAIGGRCGPVLPEWVWLGSHVTCIATVTASLPQVVDIVLFCLEQEQLKRRNLLELFPSFAKWGPIWQLGGSTVDIYIYTHTHPHTHIHTHTYIPTHMYIRTCIHMHTQMDAYTRIHSGFLTSATLPRQSAWQLGHALDKLGFTTSSREEHRYSGSCCSDKVEATLTTSQQSLV